MARSQALALAEPAQPCRQYPFDNWIRYLLLTLRPSYDDLSRLLKSARFPVPSEEYVGELQSELRARKPPRTFTSPAGRMWLRKNRLYGLVLSTEDALAAKRLVHDHPMRERVESLLVAGLSSDAVVAGLLCLSPRPFPRKVVELYRHYFWDFSRMSVGDAHAFFSAYQNENGLRLRAFYGRGPEFALWKLGYQTDVPGDTAAHMVYLESFYRFAELHTFSNDQNVALSAQLWTNQMYKSLEHLSGGGKDMEQVVAQLSNLSLKLGRREISSIEDLRNEVITIEKE